MKECVFKVNNIQKRFGKHHVLKGLNLNIYKGEIFGIIGASGSGKTTFLHTLIGFLRPDSGEVDFLLEPPHRALGTPSYKNVYSHLKAVKNTYGFASQIPSFYDDLTVRENLEFFGSLYNLPRHTLKTNTHILLHLMDLVPAQKVLGRNLSGGMERRLDLACSLMHDPATLILDEPTADLDPLLREHIYNLIKRINAKNTTIIISSHYLSDLERLCDRVAVLKNGKILTVGTPSEIKNKFSSFIQARIKLSSKKYDHFSSFFKNKSFIHKIIVPKNADEEIILLSDNSRKVIDEVSSAVKKFNYELESFSVSKPSLDELFSSIIGEDEKGGKA